MAKIRFTDGSIRDLPVKALVGRRGVLQCAVRNSLAGAPKGTAVTIRGTWRSGYSIETDPCAHCGIVLYVSQVHRDDVLIVSEARKP